MIGIEVFIVTFMSIFCFMCDMQINYKMGKYGVYKYNVCKIGQIYRLVRKLFPIFKSINNQMALF